MDMAAAPHPKRRRTPRLRPPAVAAKSSDPKPTSDSEEHHCQEPPPAVAVGEGDGVDRISNLPDAVLGEIISLLPTKDGARTQALASRWRHLWLSASAPLNLDHRCLPPNAGAQLDIISRTLSAHPGPTHRLAVPVYFLFYRIETFVAWLGSAALDHLQELELGIGKLKYFGDPKVALPASAFRFSATLRVATITKCSIVDATLENFYLPRLNHLELRDVIISDDSLHKMITGCAALECLLLKQIDGFNSIRITSHSLICIGFCYFSKTAVNSPSKEVIIEDAPLLQNLLQLETCVGLHVSLISAPKLETLGCLTDSDLHSELVFGSTVIQNLRAVSFMEEMCSVKVLAVDVSSPKSMDTVFDLLRCFPCLKKLYIQLSNVSGGRYLWRRKQLNQVKCLDSNLKTVVMKNYKGIKSHVKFASLFVLNVKRLEVMRFEADGFEYNDTQKFAAEQRRLDQLFEKRASTAARFCFTVGKRREGIAHVKHSRDLSKGNLFECTC